MQQMRVKSYTALSGFAAVWVARQDDAITVETSSRRIASYSPRRRRSSASSSATRASAVSARA